MIFSNVVGRHKLVVAINVPNIIGIGYSIPPPGSWSCPSHSCIYRINTAYTLLSTWNRNMNSTRAKYTSHHVVANLRHVTFDTCNYLVQFLIRYSRKAVFITNHSIFRPNCIQRSARYTKQRSNLGPTKSQLSQKLNFLLLNDDFGSTLSRISFPSKHSVRAGGSICAHS